MGRSEPGHPEKDSSLGARAFVRFPLDQCCVAPVGRVSLRPQGTCYATSGPYGGHFCHSPHGGQSWRNSR
eukprot:810538-Lingulodinium_polyedra.AAC.1